MMTEGFVIFVLQVSHFRRGGRVSALASLCPICQQQNACAMARGLAISACWCVDSSYDAVKLLKQYQLTHPDKIIGSDQCVCVSCLAHIANNTQIEPCAVQFYTP